MTFRISYLIIGILLVGAIIGGFFASINSLGSDEYLDKLPEDNLQTFNKTQEITNEMEMGYRNITQSWESGLSLQFFTGLVHVLNLVKKIITAPFDILGAMIYDIADVLGIGAGWITAFAAAILVTMIVFGVIALIRGYQQV